MVVRRHEHVAPVDDPGAGVEVEVDPLPHEPVLAVEEDGLALGHGLARGPVDLHAIGHEPVGSPGDLDISRGQEEVRVAPDLLDAVRDDGRLTAGAGQGQRRGLWLLSGRRRGSDEAREGDREEGDRAPASTLAAQTERGRRDQERRDIWYQPGATSK